MSPLLARVSIRIASTLFAFAALMLVGFVTSPGSFALDTAPFLQSASHDSEPLSDHAAQAQADQDDTHSHDAVTPPVWHLSPPPRAVVASLHHRLGAAPRLYGPDRPPPRAGSDFRSGPLGIL
ncbi:hypothetical protein [Aureimonas ureilytica]|uniref:hypothetical protein n=1 Tax=Aureimonas ureilytica TaxID=401562 RepID=UPI00037090D4|nr:hypothetical protein [Aureimonas ureilytica]